MLLTELPEPASAVIYQQFGGDAINTQIKTAFDSVTLLFHTRHNQDIHRWLCVN
jgi:hypothetical protein